MIPVKLMIRLCEIEKELLLTDYHRALQCLTHEQDILLSRLVKQA